MKYLLRQIVHGNTNPPIEILVENDLCIGAKTVYPQRYLNLSEEHAKFFTSDDGNLFIKDLGSRYGTFVNNIRIGSSLKYLRIGDIIGFGVKSELAKEGFVCVLSRKKSKENDRIKDQSVTPARVKIEVIDISDDDYVPDIKIENVKSTNSSSFDTQRNFIKSPELFNVESLNDKPSTSFVRTKIGPTELREISFSSIQRKYRDVLAKQCFVPLIRCDSEHFSWPPDVKNPFVTETEEEEQLLRSKKRTRRLSSDSSPSEGSADLILPKEKKKRRRSNASIYLRGISSSSSLESLESRESVKNYEYLSPASSDESEKSLSKHSKISKNQMHRRKKRAQRIQSDSSSEVDDELPASSACANQNSFPKQLKEHKYEYLSELVTSSEDSNELDESSFCLNKKSVRSNENIPVKKSQIRNRSSPHDSSHQNISLNLRNDLMAKAAKMPNSHPTSISEIETQKVQIRNNITEDIAKSHLSENYDYDPLDKTDTYSQAEEIIDISEDDYFDFEAPPHFIHTKTEPEDDEELQYNAIYREIFEGSDELEDPSDNVTSKNSAFENQEVESVETIQAFVNRLTLKDSVESRIDASKEIGSRMDTSKEIISTVDPEEEESSDDSYLPLMKSIIEKKKKPGAHKNSKSSGKTMLTEAKPLTYRPRKFRGRDEGYVERQKPVSFPKRKRGRPKKQNELQNKAFNLYASSSSTQTVCKPKQPGIPLNKTKSLTENVPKTEKRNLGNFYSSEIKNTDSFGKTIEKPMQYQISGNNKIREKHVEEPKRKKGRPRKHPESEHEVNNLNSKTPSLLRTNESQERFSADDKNQPVSSESSLKCNSSQTLRKSTSSVKVRPEKFSSRMSFLTKEEEISPPKKRNVSAKTKKSNSHTSFRNNVDDVDTASEQKKIVEKTTPRIAHAIVNHENNYPEQKHNSSCNQKIENLQTKTQNASHNNPFTTTIVSRKLSVSGKNNEKINLHDLSPEDVQMEIQSTSHSIPRISTTVTRNRYMAREDNRLQNPITEIQRTSCCHTTGSVLENLNSRENSEEISSHDPRIKNLQNKIQNISPNISCTSTNVPRNLSIPMRNNEETSSHDLSAENLQMEIQSTSHCIPPISTTVARNRYMAREDNRLHFEISSHGIIKSLTKLNTMWLQEQLNIPYPPANITQNIVPLPLSFPSYESYAFSFYPLILLEIWQNMFEVSKEMFACKKKLNKFYFRVLSHETKYDCIELKCESIIKEKYSSEPREGTITIFEMSRNGRQAYRSFGFINRHKIELLNSDLLHSLWTRFPPEYFIEAKRWTFYAYIKQKDLSLESDILMKGYSICYIRTQLRLVDALCNFKNSPLMMDIITPKLSTCQLTCPKSTDSSRDYSSHQIGIIKAICSEIYKDYCQCKVMLLHGPPGTGKTHIIIGILETLFYARKCNPNLKVLVTAPSNVAVDEIGCRLIELNERYGWKDYTVKFVRVGAEKQVHSAVAPYFIDRKAEEMHKRNLLSSNHTERDLENLQLEISHLEEEPDSSSKKIKLKFLKEQYKSIEDNISPKEAHFTAEMRYKCEILKESHIVLSTLSSCSLSVLYRTFQPMSEMNFSCCIVDESTQCTELEILQPLALGISKLILVGDEKQLPSVHSHYSKKYKFDRSMFERFCSYFESTGQLSPVLTLTEQFRMHPLICQFPSIHFYDRKLVTHPDISLRYKDFPLKPYFILDIAPSSDSSSESITDCDVLVYNICKFLSRVVDPSSSIGVIVPHESQRSACVKKLHFHFKNVEVNTVNGFQGREKDIIILWAFESNSNSVSEGFLACKRRCNVALTRAKKSLIICLNSNYLMKYLHWKFLIQNAQDRKASITVISPKDVTNALDAAVKKRK